MLKDDVLKRLESLSNPARYKTLIKAGAPKETYGVLLGNIRNIAKEIKINHELAYDLWQTKNTDARLLSVMIFDSKQIDKKFAIELISSVKFDQLLDDLMFRLIVEINPLDEVEETLSHMEDDYLKRAYWSIQVHKASKKLLAHDKIDELIKQAKLNLLTESKQAQWMMNRFLATVGIYYETYRNEIIHIGETLKLFKDQVVPKGCTRAYIPEWIAAVVK